MCVSVDYLSLSLYIYIYIVLLVVSTDLLGKGSHSQIGMVRVIGSGIPGNVMVSMIAPEWPEKKLKYGFESCSRYNISLFSNTRTTYIQLLRLLSSIQKS